MSAKAVESAGNLLTITISGMLAHPEFMTMQKSAGEILRQNTRMCILVLAMDFEGWAKEGNWGDLSFQANDAYIEKMAIVADQKWKDLVLLFTGKGMRQFPIEFFAVADLSKARAWLDVDASAN